MEYNVLVIMILIITFFVGVMSSDYIRGGKSNEILTQEEEESQSIIKTANDLESTKIKELEEEMSSKEKMLLLQEEKNKEKEIQLNKLEEEMSSKEKMLLSQEEKNKEKEIQLNKLEESSSDKIDLAQQEEYQTLLKQQVSILEKSANLSAKKAKEQLIEIMKEEAIEKAAMDIKNIVEEAELTAEKKAKAIVINTIQRIATGVSKKQSVSVVHLKDDAVRGSIIGKDGTNIKAWTTATGIEFIIDDTSNKIFLSGFDQVKREIAKLSLLQLIKNIRKMNPSGIEEIVAKTTKNINDEIIKTGEGTAMDLGIHRLHPELIKMVGKMKFRSSYRQNLLQHSIEVAKLCETMAGELGLDTKHAKRAGLLHDIGKVWPEKLETPHAIIGMELAEKHKESPEVCNAIGAHHNEIEMTALISPIIQVCDAISGSKPGARRDNTDEREQRLQDLENIAKNFDGIKNCYHMQAGRELRVIVDAENIDDKQSSILSLKIAQKIEKEMQYPGKIKVIVIRETRYESIAK